MEKQIRPVYLEKDDMTFIIEDTYDEDGVIISTEVKGFYYGEPSGDATRQFNGKLKAEF